MTHINGMLYVSCAVGVLKNDKADNSAEIKFKR